VDEEKWWKIPKSEEQQSLAQIVCEMKLSEIFLYKSFLLWLLLMVLWTVSEFDGFFWVGNLSIGHENILCCLKQHGKKRIFHISRHQDSLNLGHKMWHNCCDSRSRLRTYFKRGTWKSCLMRFKKVYGTIIKHRGYKIIQMKYFNK
jgi:hypothetical protein